MPNVIKVKPDAEGKVYVTLFGTKYEIVIDQDNDPVNDQVKVKKDKKVTQ